MCLIIFEHTKSFSICTMQQSAIQYLFTQRWQRDIHSFWCCPKALFIALLAYFKHNQKSELVPFRHSTIENGYSLMEWSENFVLDKSTGKPTLLCQIVHMGRIKTSWVFFVKPQPE